MADWERDPDGGYSAMVTPPSQRFARGVAVYPVAGRKWMAMTIEMSPTRSGPYKTLAKAKTEAVKLIR
ncbi:MAG: hypothetical protein OXH23_12380 [bacterium]|nr:hypothetical protein [bacterium]